MTVNEFEDVRTERRQSCSIFNGITNFIILEKLKFARWSRNSLTFKEPEISIPLAQEPATGPWLELDEFGLHLHTLKIHFNLILSSTPNNLSRVVYSFQASQINCVCIYSLSHTCYTPQTCHPP
jgi:hypothetical protein